MSVIVAVSLGSSAFELGRILQVEGDTDIRLETMVPLGSREIPCFWVRDGHSTFEESVRAHPAVDHIEVTNTHENETLYALDWTVSEDTFFRTISELDAHILNATGGADAWVFELRMPTHDALAEFQRLCFDADIPIDVMRIYNPTRPDAGPWYGLTNAQRRTLARAVEEGYYSIPRGVSTETLAQEFDISDQAVTERLRRAIDTLTRNTLLLTRDREHPL